MGSSASRKRENANQVITVSKPETNILKKAFDSSHFSLKSPFWSTLTHSLFSAGYSPDPLSLEIYRSFRKFLIETAAQFKKSPPLNNSPFASSLTPPPLVDELWSLAIQSGDHYNSLCQNLIGTYIHRKPQDQAEGFENFSVKYWPGYEKEFWKHDKKYTVWIFYEQFDKFLKQAYDYVYLRESLRTPQKVYEIHFHLNMIRSLLQSSRNKELAQRIYFDPNEYNSFYGLNIGENIEVIYESGLTNLTKPIRELIESKLYLGDFLVLYIEEYVKFLIMVYLQPELVTPSHELQVIWQIHRSLTVQYSEYCKLVFGKDIEFVSIDSKAERKLNVYKGYIKTYELYIAIFKQRPPALVWPPVEEWAHEGKSKGSWISLLRIIESIQQVINIYKTNEMNSSVVMSAYFHWGKNLKLEKFKSLIENKKVTRYQCSENFYRDEGENLKEMDWGRMQLPNTSVKVKNTENEEVEIEENEEAKEKKKKKTEKKVEIENREELEEEKNENLEKKVSRKKSPEKKPGKIKKELKNIEDEKFEQEIEPDVKPKKIPEKKKIMVKKSIDKPEKSQNRSIKGSNDNSRIEKSPKKLENIEKKQENLEIEDTFKRKQTVGTRKSPVKELELSHEKKKPKQKTEVNEKSPEIKVKELELSHEKKKPKQKTELNERSPEINQESPEHQGKKSKTLKNKKEFNPKAQHDNSISLEDQLKESKSIKNVNLLELDD